MRTIEDILANLDGVPGYAATKMVAAADAHAAAISRALDRGVTIAMGTDIALSGSDRPNSWDQNGAAHARAAGAPQRQAGGGLRRRPDHRGCRPAGGHQRPGQPRARDRRMDGGAPGQGRGTGLASVGARAARGGANTTGAKAS